MLAIARESIQKRSYKMQLDSRRILASNVREEWTWTEGRHPTGFTKSCISITQALNDGIPKNTMNDVTMTMSSYRKAKKSGPQNMKLKRLKVPNLLNAMGDTTN